MPKDKHLVPVRLTDVPATVRHKAARQACRYATDEEQLELLAAAVAPSDRVYWLPAEAAHKHLAA